MRFWRLRQTKAEVIMMKNKARLAAIILAALVFLGVVGYGVIGNPVVFMNNQKLKSAVKSIDSEAVQFNDVVPFAWDAVYTFEPYQSKESIENILGFTSADIKENDVNEGMVHLLFVNNNRVVASVLGYDSNLGYRIDFPSKVTFAENARFHVTKTSDVTALEYAE